MLQFRRHEAAYLLCILDIGNLILLLQEGLDQALDHGDEVSHDLFDGDRLLV